MSSLPFPTAPIDASDASARRANAGCADVVPRTDCLEVRDGETADRLRPLVSDRVLIGSGSTCQLQIVADDVAMVHATLTRTPAADRSVWSLEAIAAHPAVLVNGTPVRKCELNHGDLIGLAGVNLELVCADVAADIAANGASNMVPAAESTADEPLPAADPSMMTAAELVDALDREMQLVSELEDESPLELELQMVAAMTPPTAPLGRDPHRVRGLATLLQAARDFDSPEPSTIPMPQRVARPIRPREAA